MHKGPPEARVSELELVRVLEVFAMRGEVLRLAEPPHALHAAQQARRATEKATRGGVKDKATYLKRLAKDMAPSMGDFLDQSRGYKRILKKNFDPPYKIHGGVNKQKKNKK